MHSNESQIGGFSFFLLRLTYLGKGSGEGSSGAWWRSEKGMTPQPDTFLSFTSLISWLYHTLHFLRHRQQDSSRCIIDIHTRARPSQAVNLCKKWAFFRVLPLLYISFLKRWMTALKGPFLVINYEGSVGIYRLLVKSMQNSWLKSLGITEKFLWISGNSGFCFVSFLITTISLFSKNKMLSSSEGQPKPWSFPGWAVKQMKRETKQTRGEKVGNQKH